MEGQTNTWNCQPGMSATSKIEYIQLKCTVAKGICNKLLPLNLLIIDTIKQDITNSSHYFDILCLKKQINIPFLLFSGLQAYSMFVGQTM